MLEEQLADAVFRPWAFSRSIKALWSIPARSPKLMGLARQEAQHPALHHCLSPASRPPWLALQANLDQLDLLTIPLSRPRRVLCGCQCVQRSRCAVQAHCSARASLGGLLFDTLRRNLCLETRYPRPRRAGQGAHQRPPTSPNAGPSPGRKLETGRYLILGKRPGTKESPR